MRQTERNPLRIVEAGGLSAFGSAAVKPPVLVKSNTPLSSNANQGCAWFSGWRCGEKWDGEKCYETQAQYCPHHYVLLMFAFATLKHALQNA